MLAVTQTFAASSIGTTLKHIGRKNRHFPPIRFSVGFVVEL